MQKILTADVLFLIEILDNRARIVGGAVRDGLMNIPVNDIDIATELSPNDVLKRLNQAKIRTMTAGIEHGTVMAIVNHKPYEITTLRTDTQTDGRHAKVAFTDSYEQDAKRRDFTINALYMDKDGKIYDYVGGQTDLKNKLVRFIGNAKTRVQEDYLRILRYFRFWGKMGCGLTDTEALEACSKYADKLTLISDERKKYEFFAILSLPECDKILALMHDAGVLHHILPTANIPALSALLSVSPSIGIEEKLAVLTQNAPINLILSKGQKKLLSAFNQYITLTSDLMQERLQLFHMGIRVYHFHIYRALADGHITRSLADTLLALTVPTFPLRGQDFINLGYPANSNIKKYLQTAEQVWAQNNFSENKELVLKQFLMYNSKKG